MAVYQVSQVAIFGLYSIAIGFFRAYAIQFVAASLCFHGFMLGLAAFLGEGPGPSSARPSRIDPAAAVALLTMSLLPTIFFVILASKDYPVRTGLVALVSLSLVLDLVGGRVSPGAEGAGGLASRLNAANDAIALFVIGFVFYYFHLIPSWFLGLVGLRILVKAGVAAATLRVGGREATKGSFLGKVADGAIAALLAFELLRYVADLPIMAYRIVEYGAGTAVAVSVVEGVYSIVRPRSRAAVPKEPADMNTMKHGEHDGID